jgi:muramoyltetrapeptide carboxypeptidase
MITPSYLIKGDTVGIAAPASCLREEEMQRGLETIKSWGMRIKTGKYLFGNTNSFAGEDLQRASDFQDLLDDTEVKAIICARGGYGTVRIIGKLDFTEFSKKPKWIAGCSDITVMHSFLQQKLGMESLHSPMPRGMKETEEDALSMNLLADALSGNLKEYDVPPHPLNKDGVAEGVLAGGNLSVLYSLRGTPYDIDTKGKILFLEDVGEYLYHIDRMIMNLYIGGKFDNIKGLIIGGMNNMKISGSGFRKPAYHIINEIAKDCGCPVMFGIPAGHVHPNKTLILGRKIKMSVTGHEAKIVFGK